MAAICVECGTIHHEACWDRELGCKKPDCLNAPLKRLDAPEPRPAGAPIHKDPFAVYGGGEPSVGRAGPGGVNRAARPRPNGMRPCIGCGALLQVDEQVCDACLAVNTPDGLYHGPTKRAPGVVEGFVMSLVGLLFCGPILGPMAISRAKQAMDHIRRDPRYDGKGLAVATMVIGVMDIVFWIYVLGSRVGGGRL
jgi:hypothetical protein